MCCASCPAFEHIDLTFFVLDTLVNCCCSECNKRCIFMFVLFARLVVLITLDCIAFYTALNALELPKEKSDVALGVSITILVIYLIILIILFICVAKGDFAKWKFMVVYKGGEITMDIFVIAALGAARLLFKDIWMLPSVMVVIDLAMDPFEILLNCCCFKESILYSIVKERCNVSLERLGPQNETNGIYVITCKKDKNKPKEDPA